MSINHLVGLTIEPKLDIFCREVTSTSNADIQGDLKVGGLTEIQDLNLTGAVDIKGDVLVQGDVACNALGAVYVSSSEWRNVASKVYPTTAGTYITLNPVSIPGGFAVSVLPLTYMTDQYVRYNPETLSYYNILKLNGQYQLTVSNIGAVAFASFTLNINSIPTIFQNGIVLSKQGRLQLSGASVGRDLDILTIDTSVLNTVSISFETTALNTGAAVLYGNFEIEILQD
ncbi:MAG: hypothetical protein GTO02_21480 [Candidatus Dadabacteria bacterium]|nr:hypothetical protein [Candidatus Dadabacteria bacterium]